METNNDPDKRYIQMTTEPVSRLIPKLAIPTIISMMVTALYNMADTFFVGKINTSATGAVGIVFSVMTIIQVVGMTLGVGSGSYVARLLGARNSERANQTVSTAFFTALVCGLCLTILGEVFLDPFMRMLGSTETILPYARSYARYILFGAPYMAASFVMNVNLRSEGSAVLAMIGIASGAVLNIALDPIFIFVLDMGIGGAALATILSQLVGFMILLSHYMKGRSSLRIRLRNVRVEGALYKEILGSGMPTLFRQSVASLAAIILNASAGAFGDAAVAGMAVVTRIMMFMGSILIGFGQGFQPVAAFNYTAGLKGRVYQAFWFAVKVGTIFLSVFAALAGVFAPEVVRVFRNDPEVIRVGALSLRMQCISLPFTAFIVMVNMLFQYIGKPARASVLALSRQGLVFIPAILILSKVLGLTGIQISQAVADGITFLLTIPLARGTLRDLKADGGLRTDREVEPEAIPPADERAARQMKEPTILRHISIVYRYSQIHTSKKLRPYGLGAGQYPFILAICRNPGISQDRLSDFLVIDKGTTAKAVKTLEKAGLIERRTDREDRRVYNLFATKKGKDLETIVATMLLEWRDVLWKDFNEEEREKVYALVARMADNAKESLNV